MERKETKFHMIVDSERGTVEIKRKEYACPYSKPHPKTVFSVYSRMCTLNKDQPCWNWKNPVAVASCYLKKEEEKQK